MAFYFLFLGIILLPFSAFRLDGNLALFDIFFILSAGFGFLKVYKNFDLIYRDRLFYWAVLFCILGFLFSALLNSKDLADSLLNLIRFAFVIYVSFYIISSESVDNKLTYLMLGYVLSGALSGIGGVMQALFDLSGGWFGDPQWGRLTGFSEHPNELGFHGASSLFLAIFLLSSLEKPSFYTKCMIYIFMSMSSLSVLLSASMTAAASVLFASLVAIFFEAKERRYGMLKFFTVCTVAFILLLPFLIDTGGDNNIISRVFSLNDNGIEASTLGARQMTYSFAWERILDNPFFGAGNAGVDGLQLEDALIHNLFLRAWYEGGVLSLIGMVCIVLLILTNVVRYCTYTKYCSASIFLAATFVTLLVGAWFAPVFYQRYIWICFGLVYCKSISSAEK